MGEHPAGVHDAPLRGRKVISQTRAKSALATRETGDGRTLDLLACAGTRKSVPDPQPMNGKKAREMVRETLAGAVLGEPVDVVASQ
jgi:hypothetical protein